MRRFQETGNNKVGDHLCAEHRRLHIIGQAASLISDDRHATKDRRQRPIGLFAWLVLATSELRHAMHMVRFGAECPSPICKLNSAYQ